MQPQTNNKNDKKRKGPKFNIMWMYAAVVAVLLFIYMTQGNGTAGAGGATTAFANSGPTKEVTWTDFKKNVESGGVTEIVVFRNTSKVEAELGDSLAAVVFKGQKLAKGSKCHIVTTAPSVDKFSEASDKWAESGAFKGHISYEKESDFSNWMWSFGPIILLVLFWIWMMRRMGGRGGGVFGVGKSKAKLYDKKKGDKDDHIVTFADVAGMERAKREVSEVVDFLKNPKRYTELGGNIPKGVLLVGPPGTGKTLLARAVAGEAEVPYLSMSGSEFVEMFVGVGASRVRDTFEQAKAKAPCIIFIDEIDAIGRARSRKFDYGGNDERENTLNQLLTEMDGFGQNSGVIVLAATNRADVLDKALLRAGRFDRHVYIGNPSESDREEIFKLHSKNKKYDGSVDFAKLSRMSSGLSGGDIANICNEAVIIAGRRDKKAAQMEDFLEALDKVTRTLDKPARMNETVTFSNVAGMKKPKKELMELVQYLKNPEFFMRLGGRIPHGVLLVGPSGSGKTLLAKALAGEASVPFFSTSAAEFQGEFVGSGVSRVRELFNNAKEKAPCIIFIDEIDAIGDRNLGNSEREITLNQLLVEMDGYGSESGVIVMGATNRPDVIDSALTRPGRFDKLIYVGYPEKDDRVDIFKYYLRSISKEDDINYQRLANEASGFSGADIANVCNDAALVTASDTQHPKEKVSEEDIIEAIKRLKKGPAYGSKHEVTTTFDDVAGAERAKGKLSQIVNFLQDPERYTRLGGKIPRGVILTGPSGTGKTMLAKAVSNEANVPFVSLSGPELAYLEYKANGIDELKARFREAREKAPCIIFIDEIDAIASRDDNHGHTTRRNPVLSQLLVEIDGFDNNNGIILMGACHSITNLDKALLRPGRIDRSIYVAMPSQEERIEILKLFLKNVKVSDTVNIDNIAAEASGLSGAEISKVCNDAAIAAAEAGKESVETNDFIAAIELARQLVEGKKTEIGTITFADVAGMEEAKQEVTEIIDFLKNPEKYTRLGGRVPHGALLDGPPGTGKTMLARAVAGEANVPFFSRSGSEFVEMFVGLGAARVRELFEEAKEKAPCVVFIDEIDAVGGKRSKHNWAGNSESDQTLNQLLTEMDGIDGSSGVIVLAATNRPDMLDEALLRPGRFDRKIHISLPAVADREAIFRVHLRKVKVAQDTDISALAKQTAGFSGADIANVCNEAAIVAARHSAEEITLAHFNEAIDKVTMGLENKSMLLTPSDKRDTAIHEAGHATVSWHVEHSDPLVKISIVPRGRALGVNLHTSEERVGKTKQQFLDEICTFMGGRAAEEIVLGTVGTGALNDMQQATRIARSMVLYYGMSDKLPNISYYDPAGEMGQRPYSEEQARIIDEEVLKIVNKQYARAKGLINKHLDKHSKLVETLLEKEVIMVDDVERIFGKRPWKYRSEELAELYDKKRKEKSKNSDNEGKTED